MGSQAMNLGTKRACSHCGTKFYDMNKPDVACPKCEARLEAGEAPVAKLVPVEAPKKPVAKAKRSEEDEDSDSDEASDNDDDFESLDDLDSDDDDDVVEEIDAEDEDDEEF